MTYEAAIERLTPLVQTDEDGKLYLPVEDGRDVGIDPIVFADFKRSLEETNKKVARGEFKVGQTWKFHPSGADEPS